MGVPEGSGAHKNVRMIATLQGWHWKSTSGLSPGVGPDAVDDGRIRPASYHDLWLRPASYRRCGEDRQIQPRYCVKGLGDECLSDRTGFASVVLTVRGRNTARIPQV